MIVSRQGLVVWFHQMKHVKHIKKYGHMVHVSKKLKYAIIYVDQDKVDQTTTALHKLSFVTRVDPSYKPFIKTEFEEKVKIEDKELDYKMGI
ncbi:YlbG family protein [Gracilibacillus alcaliphilus]|uniref:YlbG family protein n=1 Tax=Gracilibacillus alcaliphilus TaxID=1401441 RepID=UPI00195986BE|nr:DUF2129 domain-containing protein [Gracilibacillus alcaliphilus]